MGAADIPQSRDSGGLNLHIAFKRVHELLKGAVGPGMGSFPCRFKKAA